MDWVPATLYSSVPIFWDALINAVLKVVLNLVSRNLLNTEGPKVVNSVAGMRVRLLVSKWAHTDEVWPSHRSF